MSWPSSPQDLHVVFDEFESELSRDQAALSIVAGAKLETIRKGMKNDRVIRVMPNTPAQIARDDHVDLHRAGRPVQAGLHPVSPLYHRGGDIRRGRKVSRYGHRIERQRPGYVFLFLEALIDAGVYVGLPRDVARTMALQTVFGSTKLVMDTGRHPADLKDMVVSPGGTTAEGLQALEKAGVPAALVEAVNAAYLKSIKLGQQ